VSLRALAFPGFAHLWRLTDGRGLLEHALLDVPRREHGYCVDDVARALVLLCREPAPDPVAHEMAGRFLQFVLDAVTADGRTHNRMSTDGSWTERPDVGDWWGRAVWGLGVAAAHGPDAESRHRARVGLHRAGRARSPYLHANAFAALGAADLLAAAPGDQIARQLLGDCVAEVQARVDASCRDWPWPEQRLRYANGALAEALIAGGQCLGDRTALDDGLLLLDFLLHVESRHGHLSVTPVGGRSRHDRGPGFDQQPIEVSSLADACARAYRATGDLRWLEGVRMAWGWFVGDNDAGTEMVDWHTEGGYDGLSADGPNLNQGAESTLALLSTAQHARRLGQTP